MLLLQSRLPMALWKTGALKAGRPTPLTSLSMLRLSGPTAPAREGAPRERAQTPRISRLSRATTRRRPAESLRRRQQSSRRAPSRVAAGLGNPEAESPSPQREPLSVRFAGLGPPPAAGGGVPGRCVQPGDISLPVEVVQPVVWRVDAAPSEPALVSVLGKAEGGWLGAAEELVIDICSPPGGVQLGATEKAPDPTSGALESAHAASTLAERIGGGQGSPKGAPGEEPQRRSSSPGLLEVEGWLGQLPSEEDGSVEDAATAGTQESCMQGILSPQETVRSSENLACGRLLEDEPLEPSELSMGTQNFDEIDSGTTLGVMRSVEAHGSEPGICSQESQLSGHANACSLGDTPTKTSQGTVSKHTQKSIQQIVRLNEFNLEKFQINLSEGLVTNEKNPSHLRGRTSSDSDWEGWFPEEQIVEDVSKSPALSQLFDNTENDLLNSEDADGTEKTDFYARSASGVGNPEQERVRAVLLNVGSLLSSSLEEGLKAEAAWASSAAKALEAERESKLAKDQRQVARIARESGWYQESARTAAVAAYQAKLAEMAQDEADRSAVEGTVRFANSNRRISEAWRVASSSGLNPEQVDSHLCLVLRETRRYGHKARKDARMAESAIQELQATEQEAEHVVACAGVAQGAGSETNSSSASSREASERAQVQELTCLAATRRYWADQLFSDARESASSYAAKQEEARVLENAARFFESVNRTGGGCVSDPFRKISANLNRDNSGRDLNSDPCAASAGAAEVAERDAWLQRISEAVKESERSSRRCERNAQRAEKARSAAWEAARAAEESARAAAASDASASRAESAGSLRAALEHARRAKRHRAKARAAAKAAEEASAEAAARSGASRSLIAESYALGLLEQGPGGCEAAARGSPRGSPPSEASAVASRQIWREGAGGVSPLRPPSLSLLDAAGASRASSMDEQAKGLEGLARGLLEGGIPEAAVLAAEAAERWRCRAKRSGTLLFGRPTERGDGRSAEVPEPLPKAVQAVLESLGDGDELEHAVGTARLSGALARDAARAGKEAAQQRPLLPGAAGDVASPEGGPRQDSRGSRGWHSSKAGPGERLQRLSESAHRVCRARRRLQRSARGAVLAALTSNPPNGAPPPAMSDSPVGGGRREAQRVAQREARRALESSIGDLRRLCDSVGHFRLPGTIKIPGEGALQSLLDREPRSRGALRQGRALGERHAEPRSNGESIRRLQQGLPGEPGKGPPRADLSRAHPGTPDRGPESAGDEHGDGSDGRGLDDSMDRRREPDSGKVPPPGCIVTQLDLRLRAVLAEAGESCSRVFAEAEESVSALESLVSSGRKIRLDRASGLPSIGRGDFGSL
uniref:Uncharacterized protein n=1 Tax=Tetraselmis sp. GSL018 TaxID=582737 RepID=A0A061RTB8_9CHLO